MEILQAGLTSIDAQQSARVLALLGFGPEDVQNLSRCGTSFTGRSEAISAALLHELTQRDEAAALIGVEEVRDALLQHVSAMTARIFNAGRGEAHAHVSAAAGAALARLGAPLGLLSATFLALQEILETEILACPSLTPEQARMLRHAVSRLLAFDLQVAMEAAVLCRISGGAGEDPLNRRKLENLERELVEKNQLVARFAAMDPLTGLINHQAIQTQLRLELVRAGRGRDPLTMICLDINGFARLNQEKGSEAGDEILRVMGRSLLRTFRETDLIGRTAADTFAVIMPKAVQDQAVEVCRRLIPNFKEDVRPHEVTFSLGVAQSGPSGHLSAEKLFLKATNAMNAARGHARAQAGFYIQRADLARMGDGTG